MTDERNRQSPGGQQSDPRQQQPARHDKDRTGNERIGKEHMGDKPSHPTRPGSGGIDPSKGDQGAVGQDTDGDGKVVRPGQPPGQSHGTGHIKK